MSAEEDARARREAWLAAGAPDYNNPTGTDERGWATGYHSVGETPVELRSPSNQSLAYNETPWTRSKFADWFNTGGNNMATPKQEGDLDAGATNPYQVTTTTPANTQFDIGDWRSATAAQRAGDLFSNPTVLAMQLLNQMGVDPQSLTPLARWVRGRTPAVSAAYLLSRGPQGGLESPEQFASYAQDFFQGAGKGTQNFAELLRDVFRQAAQGQEDWKSFFMQGQTPWEQANNVAAFLGDVLGATTMGRFNPFDRYRQQRLSQVPLEYQRAQTMGEISPGEEFFNWIKDRLANYGL